MAVLILVCWALAALCVLALGRALDNNFFTGIGATMVLMMSMVAQIN